MTAHPCREFRKVVQSLVEHAVDDLEVDIQVTVNDHVSETSHPAKAVCETGGQDVHLDQVVDGGGVIRNVSTGARGKVGRNVEHVLGTQLGTPFDGPSFIAVGPQCVDWATLMVCERLQGVVEGEQVAADDRHIELTGAQRPTLPRSTRALWAASIFRSCGT